MTVRTKAGLASQIAALLADNDLRDITEGDARSVVTDIVDSMALESALTPGAVGSGMPTFSAGALTYDGAANEITGDLTNFAAMPPLPSLIVAIMPADIDRQAEDLRMTLNLRDFALQNVKGDPVRARDLTPGCAHLILRSSAGYRLLDTLGPRPQDFDIVVARVPTATATLADLQAMRFLDAAVQFPTNEVVVATGCCRRQQPVVRRAGGRARHRYRCAGYPVGRNDVHYNTTVDTSIQ